MGTRLQNVTIQARMEVIFGLNRGRDGRANLHLLPTGEIVYPMGTIVVLLHIGERSQRHFTGHTEEVRSSSAIFESS